jgi:hypothetical protein
VTFVTNRTSLERYNNEKREQYQDQEKRDQFRKFYDNREQSTKAYVAEKNQKEDETHIKKAEICDSNFEDIDLNEKNDENDQDDQFMYNLNANSSRICKKCDVSRKRFISNNLFHFHIRGCTDDEKKINIFQRQKSENLLIIKSRVKSSFQKEYEFRSYQYVIV